MFLHEDRCTTTLGTKIIQKSAMSAAFFKLSNVPFCVILTHLAHWTHWTNFHPLLLVLQLMTLMTSASASDSSVFTNPFLLRSLFLAEDRIVRGMDEVATSTLDPRMKIDIKNYVTDQQSVREEAGQALDRFDPDSFDDPFLSRVVGNPLHVFRLFRRLLHELPAIVDAENEMGPAMSALCDLVSSERTRSFWPDDHDVDGILLSLSRIHSTYLLSTVDMANGLLAVPDLTNGVLAVPDLTNGIAADQERFKEPHYIWHVESKARLSVSDCLFLGEKRLNNRDSPTRDHLGPEYALAIEWLEAAVWSSMKRQSSEKDRKLKTVAHQRLLAARKEHDTHFHLARSRDHPTEECFHRLLGPDLSVTSSVLRREEVQLLNRKQRTSGKYRPGTSGIKDTGYFHSEFSALCRRQPLNRTDSPPDSSKRCIYLNRNNPYLKLQPLKAEVLLDSPLVHIYHDVLSDEEIYGLKSNAKTLFNRASTEDVSRDGGYRTVSNERTQSSGWLFDADQPELLHKISRRLDHVTELHVSRAHPVSTRLRPRDTLEAEGFQIGIYGPGGVYYPHIDSFQNLDPQSRNGDIWVGNRIATAMFYLSDDLAGGGTAFPKLGVAAFPSKGSVVFWYSLTHSGRRDHMSLHGACPTIVGIKWVSNKWIREGSQIFKKPCQLSSATE